MDQSQGGPKTAAYEEFLRWKASLQGKSLSDTTNTTIIKSDDLSQARGFTQDQALLPQNPEEEAQIIEQMKYQPKGLGKGALIAPKKDWGYNTLKDFSGKQRYVER